MGPTLPTILELLGASLLALGLLVVLRGIRGRRVGDTPACRRCHYNLSGIGSSRCPECGAQLHPANIVQGTRVRRPRLVMGGAILAGLAITLLTVGSVRLYRQIDWYRLRPTGWVIDDLNSPSNAVASRAWNELLRRDRSNGFSRRNFDRIVATSLAEQSAATPGPLAGSMTDWLGGQVLNARLSESQKRQFFRQLMRLQLRVRRVVTLGDPVPYTIEIESRTPSGGAWWVRLEDHGRRIDGHEVPQSSSGSFSVSGFFGKPQSSSHLQCDRAGPHTVEVTERLQILYGGRPTDEDASRKKLHEEDLAFSAPFTVSADPDAGGVRVLRDPALRERLRASLKPTSVRYSPASKELSCALQWTNLPVDVDLEIVLRSGGKEYCLGGISESQGTSGQSDPSCTGEEYDGLTTGDVILRPDLKGARETLDLVRVWGGEPLVFPHVPVQRLVSQ